MESLLQVMAAKKRELSALQTEKQGSKKPKYLRRAEVEDLRFEKQKLQRQEDEEEKKQQNMQMATKKRKLETPAVLTTTEEKREEEEDEATLSWAEMKRRLRELGAPVTLFNETDRARMARLRTAEHDAATRREDELGDGHATRNEFVDGNDGTRNRDDDDDDDDEEDRHGSADDTRVGGDASADDTANDDDQDDVMVVYKFFKGMLRRWEQDLADRPEHIKRTAQGKMATKTMKQCKDYIRPLFKLCKKRDVSADILPNLAQIVRFCKAGEFVQANDAYIKLAIGNAAWPIGVTMVGIHERTGREKINANKQAHVMNNEAQRKYITSVKRLISYAQSVANVLPSKKVN